MHDAHGLPGSDVVADGVRLHVVRHGRSADSTQPPILFLHGLSTTGRIWADVARDLEHLHLSVIPDLAACGASERPARERWSPTGQARLMLALLSALDAEHAVVVGHDIGGAVAVHMAALARHRISALVLINTPLHADVWPPPAVVPLLVPALRPLLRRTTRLGQVRGVCDVAGAFDAAAAAAALEVVATDPPPTLVLWGADDTALTPAYGARVAAGVPGATWVPVPDAGSTLPAQRPERVAEEIAGFLAEAPAGALTEP